MLALRNAGMVDLLLLERRVCVEVEGFEEFCGGQIWGALDPGSRTLGWDLEFILTGDEMLHKSIKGKGIGYDTRAREMTVFHIFSM
jgi:hypothetical protein